MTTTVIRGNLILPDEIVEQGQLVVENGRIQAVTKSDEYKTTLDLGNAYIAPGFIDIHMHGIAGADTMEAKREAIKRMAVQLAKHGVTGFLPTTVTQSLDLTIATIASVRAYMTEESHGARAWSEEQTAQVLGMHLEGPFINREAKGAQNENFIISPEVETVQRVLETAQGLVRKVTLAPEISGASDVIPLLLASGINVSVGHTTASFEEAEAAFALGARHITHCFNAMTGLHHRKPGVVGAALLHDEVYTELIADGVHVHPGAMRLMIRVKGRDKVMLISDSIAAADMPEGEYSLGGLTVHVRDGQARLVDGTLAGSTLTLDRAVRNLVNLCGVSLCDAIYMASTTPAAAIGLGEQKGRLHPGYDADLVVLDESLMPTRILV